MGRYADAALDSVLHLHVDGRCFALGLLCNDHFQVGYLYGLAQRALSFLLAFLIRLVDAEAGIVAHVGFSLEDVMSSLIPVNRSVDSLDIHQAREAGESVLAVHHAVMARNIYLIDAALLETDLVCGNERTNLLFSHAKNLFLLLLEGSFSQHGLQ